MGDTLDLERRLQDIRAEVAAMTGVGFCDAHSDCPRSRASTVATLSEALSTIEALRKDAERLDWAMAEGHGVVRKANGDWYSWTREVPHDHGPFTTFRDAIDSAMSEPTP